MTRKRIPLSPTRRAVAELRSRYPTAMAGDIARTLEVSRECVRKHLVALGLPTTGKRRAPEPLRNEIHAHHLANAVILIANEIAEEEA